MNLRSFASITILLVGLIGGLLGCQSGTVPGLGWGTDYAAALKQGKAERKPILVVFSTTWCTYCRNMKEDVWPRAEVKTAVQPFVVVEVDGERQPEVAAKYQVTGYPTLVALDAEGRLIGAIEGFADAPRLVEHLNRWATPKIR